MTTENRSENQELSRRLRKRKSQQGDNNNEDEDDDGEGDDDDTHVDITKSRWSDEDVVRLLGCIRKHGHKNYSELSKHLPKRSVEDIKSFLRTSSSQARRFGPSYDVIDSWINTCVNVTTKAHIGKCNDTLQIAQVFKLLSIDGLIENHPLPDRCNGIDFSAAYNVLYQALMGYPIQPINDATAAFVCQAMGDLNLQIKNDKDIIATLTSKFKKKFKVEHCDWNTGFPAVGMEESTQVEVSQQMKKPVKVYQRKKTLSEQSQDPCLKVVVTRNNAEASFMNCSVTVEGNSGSSNIVVPLVQEVLARDDEKITSKVYQSIGYNPLEIPEKWLKVYFNLKPARKNYMRKQMQTKKESDTFSNTRIK